jgi:Transposase IS4
LIYIDLFPLRVLSHIWGDPDRYPGYRAINKAISLVRWEQINRYFHVTISPDLEPSQPPNTSNPQRSELLGSQLPRLSRQSHDSRPSRLPRPVLHLSHLHISEPEPEPEILQSHHHHTAMAITQPSQSQSHSHHTARAITQPLQPSLPSYTSQPSHTLQPSHSSKLLPHQKVEYLANHLHNCFKRYWRPGTHISVDECIQPFCGRSADTVNIPTKPRPLGFKIWPLADTSGYIIDFLFHRKGTRPDQGPQGLRPEWQQHGFAPTQAVVLELVLRMPDHGQNHVVWTDNLFI